MQIITGLQLATGGDGLLPGASLVLERVEAGRLAALHSLVLRWRHASVGERHEHRALKAFVVLTLHTH